MTNLRVTLSVIPARPKAGEVFLLALGLSDGPAEEDLEVSFEKHRIYVDTSGTRELCPIQPDFFADGGAPEGFDLLKGEAVGITKVQILANAENPPCPYKEGAKPRRVEFPDRLVFTAFVHQKGGGPVPGDLVAREHVGVTVDPPAKLARDKAPNEPLVRAVTAPSRTRAKKSR